MLWYVKEGWIWPDGVYWCVSEQSLSALTCVVQTLQVWEYISHMGIDLSPDEGWQAMKAWNSPVLVWRVSSFSRVRWRARESKTGILCNVQVNYTALKLANCTASKYIIERCCLGSSCPLDSILQQLAMVYERFLRHAKCVYSDSGPCLWLYREHFHFSSRVWVVHTFKSKCVARLFIAVQWQLMYTHVFHLARFPPCMNLTGSVGMGENWTGNVLHMLLASI